jgi:hypothetical protein
MTSMQHVKGYGGNWRSFIFLVGNSSMLNMNTKGQGSEDLNCLWYRDEELFKDGWIAEAHLHNATREFFISESY